MHAPRPRARACATAQRDDALEVVADHEGVRPDQRTVLGSSNAVTGLVDTATPRVVRAHRRSSLWADSTYTVLRHARTWLVDAYRAASHEPARWPMWRRIRH